MFHLSAEKSKLTVLEKGIITSGSVNAFDVLFRFDNDWDGMERIAVFRVGSERVSVVLNDTNQCKIPWECLRENDIGKELLVGVYGRVGENVVLPTLWASIGRIQEGTRLGDSALPPTPSATEQLLAEVIAARDAALEAAHRAEVAAGIAEADPEPNPEPEPPPSEGEGDDSGSGSEDNGPGDGDIATDDEVNEELDGIFGT